MSNRALHIAVDIGSERVTAAEGRPGQDERPRTIPLGQARDAASSVVFVVEDGFVFGDAAERRAMGAPERVLRDYAHRIGDDVPLRVAGRAVRAEEAYAAVVEWVLASAADLTGDEPGAVTAVVPLAWGPHRRARLTAALESLGVAASLMSAPEAAAHHRLAVTGCRDEVFAVYDLGAGSCDLAIVRVRKGMITIAASATLSDVGGADFDDAVLDHVASHVAGARTAGPLALAALRRECVRAKEALSSDTETVIPVVLPEAERTLRLVRDEFETLIEGDVRRTVTALADLCEDAGIAVSDLSCVVAVGGSSRVPRVVQLLSEMLGITVERDADPDSALARGAASRPFPTEVEPVAAIDESETVTTPVAPASGAMRRMWWLALGAVVRALAPFPTRRVGSDESAAAETPSDAREELPPALAPASRPSASPRGDSRDLQTSPPPPTPVVRATRRGRVEV